MKRFPKVVLSVVAGVAALTAAACSPAQNASGGGGKSTGPYKIALSMSYSGNDWQTIAMNLIKATAGTSEYAKMVNLKVDIAGTSIPNQIQTINNEVAAGMNAIVVYPLSPTALNSTIQAACDKGVVVFAYDSYVTAPCAYNVRDNVVNMGYQGMLWLAKKMVASGNTNLGIITGVAGTTADTDYLKGVHKALMQYPSIKVVATAPGLWDPAKIKTAFSGMYAAHPNMGGVWGTFACEPVHEVLSSQGKPDIPCAGGDTNSERLLMLPASQGGQGLNNISVGAPAYNGELAFMLAVDVLQGKKVAKDTVLPTETVTQANVKLGSDPSQGVNVFLSSSVSPGFVDSFWSPLVGQGLKAAQTGDPDPISTPKPCGQVPGCLTFDKLNTNLPTS